VIASAATGQQLRDSSYGTAATGQLLAMEARSRRSMWIPGPITTVHYKHSCRELAAVARVGLVTRRWLSDKNRSVAVVLGNQPHSVSGIAIMMNGHD
jgi:hypothetical protein